MFNFQKYSTTATKTTTATNFGTDYEITTAENNVTDYEIPTAENNGTNTSPSNVNKATNFGRTTNTVAATPVSITYENYGSIISTHSHNESNKTECKKYYENAFNICILN